MANSEFDNDKTRTHVILTRGTMVQHYRIVEKIGAGGMGEVYLAEDTELGRQVALKFLSLSLAAENDHRARFKREAQAAAKLNHPNIVTIHEVSDFNGRPYIVMEHVVGRSLHDFCHDKPLPTNKIIDTAIQICDGLSKAHKAGIIHRDIKSSNIVVDADGRPKILDFGLATFKGSEKVTKAGSTIGTVAYMSPEQAQGQKIDHRSDLFSFGVVLYELIAGCTPFKHDNEAATLKAITQDNPEPLARYKSDIPDELQRTVSKLLEKDRELRYQTAADILSDLKKIRQQDSASQDKLRSVAVLPFRNMSADSEQEFFCGGIAEDIINDLTRIEGLRVAARTSSFSFKDTDVDIREICAKLNVTSILEGSVRKVGNRLRVTAQLINASDGYHIWSERFDRELDDVFAVQEEIAANVAAALKLKLTGEVKKKLAKRNTENVEAYEYYLKARQLSRQTQKEKPHAINLYQLAIGADPKYALAFAGLADMYTESYMYYTSELAILEKANAASSRALELDADLAESHSARGYYLSQASNYQEAEKEFQRALELNPMSYYACYHYGRVCIANGKHELAREMFERAIQIDPADIFASSFIGVAYSGLGETQKATEASLEALRKLSKHLQLNPDNVRALQLIAVHSARTGNHDDARKYLDQIFKLSPSDTGVLYNSACAYALLGDADRSLELLDKALSKGQNLYDWARNDSDLDSLHDNPRYKKLLERQKKTKA